MKQRRQIPPVFYVLSAGAGFLIYERFRKNAVQKKIEKSRKKNIEDIGSVVSSASDDCDRGRMVLQDFDVEYQNYLDAGGTWSKDAYRDLYERHVEGLCEIASKTPEQYVGFAESLANEFRTHQRFGWYENWWEYDEDAYNILARFPYVEQYSMAGPHYEVVTGGRDLFTDLNLLDVKYYNKLPFDRVPRFDEAY